MLLKRMHGKLSAASPEQDIRNGADELHAFFVKYERILGNEIKSL